MIEPGAVSNSESIESTTWNIRNKSQMHELIEELCCIHSDLCDTCSIASDYFQVQMVTIIGTKFLYILLSGYYIFLRIFGPETAYERKDNIEVTYLSIQIGMVFSGIVLACNSGHTISEQVHRFRPSISSNKCRKFCLKK